jgi:hypothetical protein
MSDRQDTDKRRKLMAHMDDKKAASGAPNFKMLTPCGGLPTGNYPEDKLVEYVPRDPAVLAELPEVKAMIAAAVRDALERAASVARNACLVDPDGGNPTEDERFMCEEAYRRIRTMIP